MSEEDRLTIQACRSEARALGYTLLVDEVPNLGEFTHAAFAAPVYPRAAVDGTIPDLRALGSRGGRTRR
jgi:hypothetical protein